uniref:Uncharacterized protein n=1 Tax=Panagrolaimus sp. PS1159 TaxID=55785 RepID=A0AC35GSC6_9BILA
MTKFTTLFFLCSLAVYGFCAPSGIRPQNVQLTPEAQKVVDALKSLLKADVMAKIVQIFASQGPNSRDYISSLNNITPDAARCIASQIKPISMEIKDESIITPQDAINAYLKACSQYRAQLEPMFTAFMGAMQELNTTMNDNSDLPQSYQRFFQNYNELSQQISANPNSTENGPKIQALVNELKVIPESDSEIVAQKFPFLKELILPSEKVHADFISILEGISAKANGQQIDQVVLKEKGQRVLGYIISKLDQILGYIKTEIDNYQIPAEIANDVNITKIANAFGQNIETLSNQLFNLPWFNTVMNAMITGKFDDLSQNSIAA